MLAAGVETARPELDSVEEYVSIDDAPEDARDFSGMLEAGSPDTPEVTVEEDDMYAFVYTSGTTGRPKGSSTNTGTLSNTTSSVSPR